MPVKKNITYTNIITNPNTDDGYTGTLYTWVNHGRTNPCTFYTSWFNSSDANDSNAKGYILENGIYKAKSLWDDILQVDFSAYMGFTGAYVYFEDIGIRVYAQRQSVKQTSTKLYLPVKKNTGIIMYADDDYEGDLYAWEVVSNRDGDVITTIYSPLQLGTDTNWSTTQVYELNNNIFHSHELWGANGLLADYGYDDSSYPTIQSLVSKDYIRWTKETYPRLSRVSADASYTIPIEGGQIKTYLPVRKKNGTTQYYT